MIANDRGGGIRTHDPSVPNAVRYQATLRPDNFRSIIAVNGFRVKSSRDTIFNSNLDYSRVEVVEDARHRVRSCGPSPRVPCNEAYVVRSARLNGKKIGNKIKNKKEKIVKVTILEKISYIAVKKLIITSPFFYE